MDKIEKTEDSDRINSKGSVEILSNKLREIADSTGIDLDYFGICVCALELLEKYEGIAYDFPIDIEKIVKNMGIEIAYQPLNYESGMQNMHIHKIVGKVIKKKNRFTCQDANKILIDIESKKDEQRFALAHGLADFLLHIEDERYSSEYRVMPMLFKKKEEMIADIFAIFLLIPLPIFLKEFYLYIGEDSVPVKTSEWLRYLSNIAEIPYEDVAIGYQDIRYVLSYIYNLMEKDETISNKDFEFQTILNKQSKRMIQLLEQDGLIKKLFC